MSTIIMSNNTIKNKMSNEKHFTDEVVSSNYSIQVQVDNDMWCDWMEKFEKTHNNEHLDELLKFFPMNNFKMTFGNKMSTPLSNEIHFTDEVVSSNYSISMPANKKRKFTDIPDDVFKEHIMPMSSEAESLRAELTRVKQQLKKEKASADFMRIEMMSCMCFGNKSDWQEDERMIDHYYFKISRDGTLVHQFKVFKLKDWPMPTEAELLEHYLEARHLDTEKCVYTCEHIDKSTVDHVEDDLTVVEDDLDDEEDYIPCVIAPAALYHPDLHYSTMREMIEQCTTDSDGYAHPY